jgi:hypothetical protein
LRRHVIELGHGKHVAQIGLDLIGILLPDEIAEIEGLVS